MTKKGVRNRFCQWKAAGRGPLKTVPDTFSGFSLLEIILALAILAGSLAALGEVMRQADRNAALSSEETQAQIIASSIMDELIAGSRPATAANRTVYNPEEEPAWLYSIAIENTSYASLVGVHVRVEQQLEPEERPAGFELVRWVMNPDFAAQAGSESDASSTSESSSSSSSSSSGGTSQGGASSSGSSAGSGGSGGGP